MTIKGKKVGIIGIGFEPVHGLGGYHATEQWGENEHGYFNMQTGTFCPKQEDSYHSHNTDVMYPGGINSDEVEGE